MPNTLLLKGKDCHSVKPILLLLVPPTNLYWKPTVLDVLYITLSFVVSWAVTPCSWLPTFQRNVSFPSSGQKTRLQGITNQKTTIDIFIGMITSNLISIFCCSPDLPTGVVFILLTYSCFAFKLTIIFSFFSPNPCRVYTSKEGFTLSCQTFCV